MENDRPLLPEMLVPVRAMPHRAGVPVGEPNDGRPVCAGRCPSNPRGLGPSWAYYNYGGDEWNSMRGGLLEAARGAIRAMKENRAMTDQDRLNAIVRDITTRQVTMYAGRPSTPGELMAREIVRLRAMHPVIVVYDAHSIASRVPRLFDGALPQFNIGTNGGITCDPTLITAIAGHCGNDGDARHAPAFAPPVGA